MVIVACFYPPTTTTVLPTTAGQPDTTIGTSTQAAAVTDATSSTTTTAVPPTTTTMNYCVEQNGMNAPLTIQPSQVTSNPSPNPTTPAGDINPTSTTTGLNFPTPNPQINVTLDQPATLTVVYVPVDRPNQPSNVDAFTVVFVYPNGTSSQPLESKIPSAGATTPSDATTQTTSTVSTTGVFAPSDVSPQVDLPVNFRVPEGTVIVITITSTSDQSNPRDVCIHLLSAFSLAYAASCESSTTSLRLLVRRDIEYQKTSSTSYYLVEFTKQMYSMNSDFQ